MAGKDDENLNDLLSAYLDDELDAEAQARVEAHLVADREARALYDELRATRTLLSSLPRGRAPDDLTEVITSRLERRELLDDADEPGEVLAAGRLRMGKLLATAAMLAVVCSVGFVIYQGMRDAPYDQLAFHKRDAAPPMNESLATRPPIDGDKAGADEGRGMPATAAPAEVARVEVVKEREEKVASAKRPAKGAVPAAAKPATEMVRLTEPAAAAESAEPTDLGDAVVLDDESETLAKSSAGVTVRLGEAVAKVGAALRERATYVADLHARQLEEKSSPEPLASVVMAESEGAPPDAELAVEVASVDTLATVDKMVRSYGASDPSAVAAPSGMAGAAQTYAVRIDRSALPGLVTAFRAEPEGAVRLRSFRAGSYQATTWAEADLLAVDRAGRPAFETFGDLAAAPERPALARKARAKDGEAMSRRAGKAGTLRRPSSPADDDRAALRDRYALLDKADDGEHEQRVLRSVTRSRAPIAGARGRAAPASSAPQKQRANVESDTVRDEAAGKKIAPRPARQSRRPRGQVAEVRPVDALTPASQSAHWHARGLAGQAQTRPEEVPEQITLLVKVFGPAPAAVAESVSQSTTQATQSVSP